MRKQCIKMCYVINIKYRYLKSLKIFSHSIPCLLRENSVDMVLPTGRQLYILESVRIYTLSDLQLNSVAGYRVLIKFNDDTVTIRGNNYAFYPFMVSFIQGNLGIIPFFMSEAKPIEFSIDEIK